MSDDNEPKLRVKDRRMFNADGSLRTPDPDEAPRETASPEPAPETAKSNVVSLGGRERTVETPTAAAPAPEPAPEPEPPPSHPAEASLFNELVHSLAYQAAMFMGLVRDPLGPQYPTDLRAARQTIDMIAMLKEKTRGNLTPDEATSLERILTDLRMNYVSMTRGGLGKK